MSETSTKSSLQKSTSASPSTEQSIPAQKSNTGLVILIILVGLISITALILSLLPLFKGDNSNGENGSGDCPKDGCDIKAGKLSATDITTKTIVVSDTAIFPEVQYGTLEATTATIGELTTTTGKFTNFTSTNISNTSLIRSKFLNTDEITLFSILSQPGVKVDNGTGTGIKDVELSVKNYFYTVQLFQSSSQTLNLKINLDKLRNGQSMLFNIWSGVPTVNVETKVTLQNITPPSTNTDTEKKIVLTTAGGANLASNAKIEIFLRPAGINTSTFKNYLAYYADNNLYIMLVSSS